MNLHIKQFTDIIFNNKSGQMDRDVNFIFNYIKNI